MGANDRNHAQGRGGPPGAGERIRRRRELARGTAFPVDAVDALDVARPAPAVFGARTPCDGNPRAAVRPQKRYAPSQCRVSTVR
eukprot:gene15837-12109_t